MSSETFSLRVRGHAPPKPGLWRAIWDLGWGRIGRMGVPAAHAWRAPYFEDLLPDQQDRLMEITSDGEGTYRIAFHFPDFGGHFSTQVTLLVDWLALSLGAQYLALHRLIEAAGYAVDGEALPDLTALLARPPRTVLRSGDELAIVYRAASGAIELASAAGMRAPTEEEAARAASLLEAGTTEDPVRTLFSRGALELAKERAKQEAKWMAPRLEAWRARLGVEGPAILAHALADPSPPARALLSREGVKLASAPGGAAVLAPLLEGPHRLEALDYVASGYERAKPSDKDALAVLVSRALEDPALRERALAVTLADRHLDSDTLARLAAIVPSIAGAQRRRVWGMLERASRHRGKSGARPLAALLRALLAQEPLWSGLLDALSPAVDGSDVDELERAAIEHVARAGIDSGHLRWLFGAMVRRGEGAATEGGVPDEVERSALALAGTLALPAITDAMVVAWASRLSVASRRPKRGAVAAPVPEGLGAAVARALAHPDGEVRAAAARALEIAVCHGVAVSRGVRARALEVVAAGLRESVEPGPLVTLAVNVARSVPHSKKVALPEWKGEVDALVRDAALVAIATERGVAHELEAQLTAAKEKARTSRALILRLPLNEA